MYENRYTLNLENSCSDERKNGPRRFGDTTSYLFVHCIKGHKTLPNLS